MHFVNLSDAGDPVKAAQRYDAEGADELVLLDITASSICKTLPVYVYISQTKKSFYGKRESFLRRLGSRL